MSFRDITTPGPLFGPESWVKSQTLTLSLYGLLPSNYPTFKQHVNTFLSKMKKAYMYTSIYERLH